jgi:hypothetical protein
MIPPLPEVRLRSITRWLKDNQPTLPSEELSSRATAMDEQMIEAFETREGALKAQMMREQTWGTGEGMQSFPAERLTMWSDVVSEFLPTTDQPQEA